MFKKLRLFFNWRAWGTWGLFGPDPFMPYEWRLFLGPVCLCRLTDRKPRRLSRQERRNLERQLAKRARSLRKLLVLVLAAALAGAACAPHGWHPPQDEVFVQVAPGTGWEVRADRRTPEGVWYREVTVIVMVVGPARLRGAACTVSANGREVAFGPNPDHTWTVYFRLAEGQHHLRVVVGDRTWERTLYVWREVSGV